ncbi:MAG: hypothetical protein IPJ41_12605 [Phycisphaerales bacterium]|nr:hypothetical protein [Phycisphaerales bacterium]
MKPLAALLVLATALSGCVSARYMAPGRGADMSLFSGVDPRDAQTDGRIREVLHRPALAQLPTPLAVARVQSTGYASYSSRAWGSGAYSVLTTRDIETDEDFDRLANLEQVERVAPISRLLLPGCLNTDTDLRAAAAKLGADLLLVYTIDTTFNTEDGFAPLTVVTLGLFPTKTARVNSTASAALLDTRSGLVYATAEGAADTSQLANAWTSRAAVDQSRRRAERQALDEMLTHFEHDWPGVAIRI